jgi:hypothetical protein
MHHNRLHREALSFIEESEPGEVFDNEEGRITMWASLWKTIILSMPVEK